MRAVDLTAALGGPGASWNDCENKSGLETAQRSCFRGRPCSRARRSRAVRSTAPGPAYVPYVSYVVTFCLVFP